jgi:hypothetical protein
MNMCSHSNANFGLGFCVEGRYVYVIHSMVFAINYKIFLDHNVDGVFYLEAFFTE